MDKTWSDWFGDIWTHDEDLVFVEETHHQDGGGEKDLITLKLWNSLGFFCWLPNKQVILKENIVSNKESELKKLK